MVEPGVVYYFSLTGLCNVSRRWVVMSRMRFVILSARITMGLKFVVKFSV